MNRCVKAVAWIAAAFFFAAGVRADPGTATVAIDIDKPGVSIPPSFIGLMTEEINHAFDGGLYAELIQNRTFQDDAKSPAHWSVVGSGKLELDRTDPVNKANPVYAKLALTGGVAGIANDGFWGIPVKPETTYSASFYVKATDGLTSPITATIVGEDGTQYAKAATLSINTKWQKITLPLKTAAGVKETSKARFVLSAEGAGAVSFSHVSLFPPTYQNTPNGLRPDLMELMAALKPAFIRLPGGNYLEGNTFNDRFDWKKQIGPVDERPGHMGCWSYRSSDGMGLTQMLLWCKQLDADPVLGVFAGYTLHGAVVKAGSPELAKYVEEALEEIEYVTGGPETKWGKQRIADGFPEPFKLRYVEIGNEDWFDKSGSYDGRYAQFHDAIRAKYPDLKLMSTMQVKSRKPDLVDDHYYLAPRQMAEKGTGYHTAKRDGPQIFLGEWAAQNGKPTPTLRSGLADAAFLCGLEQDADLIPMECYAPLLVNVNPGASQWGTNLIGYDALHSFGSPSYYTQMMIAQNKGDTVLPAALTVTDNPLAKAEDARGGVGVGSWHTQVEYKDLAVTHDGKTLTAADPTQSADGWHFVNGNWTAAGGVLTPNNKNGELWAYTGDPKWTDYTLTVKARKLGGAEGFLILYHAVDDKNYQWWNVGGWGNKRTQLETGHDGERSAFGPSANFTVQTNRWYDLKIEVAGRHVKCYADGKLISEADDSAGKGGPPLYVSANLVHASNEVVVKVVNFGGDDFDTTLDLRGATILPEGTATVIAGDPAAMNSIEEPTKIAPKTEPITDASTSYKRTFPANSFTVLRFKMKS